MGEGRKEGRRWEEGDIRLDKEANVHHNEYVRSIHD